MTRQTKTTMGNMISSLRKEHGMTQAELAEKMSVTDKAVSKWERDLSCPDINSLPRLAEIFEITVDELMQTRNTSVDGVQEKPVAAIVSQVIKAVTVAMGVAVTVLAIMGKVDVQNGFILMGIGLTCAGISLLQNNG